MARFAIVQGHPDRDEGRLNRALAARYAEAARNAGHEVRYIDAGGMELPVLRRPETSFATAPPREIADAQSDVAWADHIVFFYPLWIGDMPAALKIFLEHLFRPGFALAYGGRRRFPRPLLRGKSARIVVTMGMPALLYRNVFRAHSVESLRTCLRMAGINPVRRTFFGGVTDASECRRRKWLDRIARLARRDGEPQRHNRALTVGATTAIACAVMTAAYASYVAVAFARFGQNERRSTLLESIMPDYDVRLRHETRVFASPSAVFDALSRTNIDGSPVVAALFRARAIVMGSRHADRPLPSGLLAQFDSFGWRALAEDPGRELVFGAVTQPWQPDPVFRGLPAGEFVRFGDPGFAKIVFTLRVDPLPDGTAIARTETRVQTTDAESRKRFRRYWAFLSPGMDLIRIVLLQQIKAEAEGRNARAMLGRRHQPSA
ncbi:MAG: NAD(P)H-dependent oxidoreductase [Candidatus Eremiobacteraeota bacterium]|nr:NAD(P)H-dependent oxidoreductase [Candidatus Eremiobacteraeota bacterium]